MASHANSVVQPVNTRPLLNGSGTSDRYCQPRRLSILSRFAFRLQTPPVRVCTLKAATSTAIRVAKRKTRMQFLTTPRCLAPPDRQKPCSPCFGPHISPRSFSINEATQLSSRRPKRTVSTGSCRGEAASAGSFRPTLRALGRSETVSSSTAAPKVLGRRRVAAPSARPGSSRGRRQRFLPTSFLTDANDSVVDTIFSPHDSVTSGPWHWRPESLARTDTLGMGTRSLDPNAMRSTVGALGLSTAAASLMFLAALPAWQDVAFAAEFPAEETSVQQPQLAGSFLDDVIRHDLAIMDEVNNLGFLPVPEVAPALEAQDPNEAAALPVLMAASQPQGQNTSSETRSTSPQDQITVMETPVPPQVAPVQRHAIDDVVVPLNGTSAAHCSSASSSIQAVPAIYIPNAAPGGSGPPSPCKPMQGSSSSQGGLLVPVAAAAALSAAPAASALVEAAANAPAVVSAAAEPLVAGAAAATEAVASAAATVAEPVVASAAAAAASAGSGLSTKLSLIVAQSLQHLGVGGVAGAVGATVVYPLDTVKTRMQAQIKPGRSSVTKAEEDEGDTRHLQVLDVKRPSPMEDAAAAGSGSSEPYKNEVDCLVRMVKEEGLPSLYSGLGPQLVGIAPEKAVKLAVNEVLLAILEALLPGTRVWMLELIAGGGGGACQVVFTNPVEAIKVRMQAPRAAPTALPSPEEDRTRAAAAERAGGAQGVESVAQAGGIGTTREPGKPSGVASSGRQRSAIQVMQELGLKGLYTGSSLTLARDVPSTAIFFACYAFLTQPEQQERLLAAASGLSPSVYVFLAACASSIPSAVLVTPLDVVKTRMQILSADAEGNRPNAAEVARQLLGEEGPSALFKGGLARALRVGPQLGITLMTYDWLCQHWK